VPPSAPQPDRRWTWLTAGIGVLLGLVTGLLTAVQATRVVDGVPVGALAAFGANFGGGVLIGWGLRAREAAALPAFGWLLAVFLLIALPRPGGDVLLPGSGAPVVAFLLGGIAGSPASIFVAAALLRRQAKAANSGSRSQLPSAAPTASRPDDIDRPGAATRDTTDGASPNSRTSR